MVETSLVVGYVGLIKSIRNKRILDSVLSGSCSKESLLLGLGYLAEPSPSESETKWNLETGIVDESLTCGVQSFCSCNGLCTISLDVLVFCWINWSGEKVRNQSS